VRKLAYGEDAVWAVSSGKIYRIDPITAMAVGTGVPVDFTPEAIAAGGGFVWVASESSGADDRKPEWTVAKIDPKSMTVTAKASIKANPASMAFAAGALWIVDFGGTTVIKLDTNLKLVGEVKVDRSPIAITFGENALWVANRDGHSVSRVDPQTSQVTTIPIPEEPHRIAAGAGGVWVSNFRAKTVTRIDPATNKIVGGPIPVGFSAGAIAARGGSVWVTSDYRADPNRSDDIVVIRISVAKGKFDNITPVGGAPLDIAASPDSVWVAVSGQAPLVKLPG
jgi:DNA-binding beta-propeller fold protein YncE